MSFKLQKLQTPLLTLAWLLTVCPVFGAGFKQLHGHVPEAARHLTAIARMPATNELHLAIGVPLRDPAGLDQFLADVYNPASPNYRHFLTPAEFTARFSATEADYAAVKNFALTNGFKISQPHGNRLLLDVTAKAADVERAFHLKLNRFRHPTENRDFFAPDAEPTVDTALPVVDVSGLSDYYRPHPKLRKRDPKLAAPKGGSAPDSSGNYFGDDFRNAYAPGVTLTGAGQSVGLFQLDGYYPNDIAAYAQKASGGRTNIQVVTVPVGSTNWNIGTNGGNVEVSLDIEMAMAMAPGLSKILVFEGPASNWPNDILNAMAASNTVKNLSSSWGWGGGPSTSTDNIFKTMAAQGQSFFNASGDSDAFTVGSGSVNGVDNTSLPNAPSSSPYITQVGGTTLTTVTNGANDTAFSSESVWNWGGGQGSSGGVSSYYSIPSWQQGISMTANGGSTTQRNIPDVALTADQVYVISGGSGAGGSVGGTSCAAPLWAGFMALVNQQVAAVTGSATNSVGFINPAVYEIARESIYNNAFHDTLTSNNEWSSSPSQYIATLGYDLCTGLGTPNGTNLINALATPDSLVIISNTGFSASGSIGGAFTPSSQSFILTNTSAASLNWSVVSTSAWLTVSSSNGTLGVHAATTVTANLAANATNYFSTGLNTMSLWFSNAATGVTHYRLFTVQVIDSLELLTTNSLSGFGLPGGPFSPGTQAFTFTNLTASTVSWSLINTCAWLSVSSGNGSIPGNGSASVTVSTNAATAGLAIGNYQATLVLSNQSSHIVQNLAFTMVVSTNLVQNSGFETGDFTDWTLTDNGGPDQVDDGSTSGVTPYSGSYEFIFGQANSSAYLSQTLPTSPGQNYLLSFWLNNPVAGANTTGNREKFQVNWNTNSTSTNTIYTLSNPAAFGWTSNGFIVIATSTSTTLQFAVRNDPDYFALDDVSVIPVNPPAITQQPMSQTNFVGSNVVFTAAASGTAPLSYHWRTNGVNLVNNAIVSGATTNVLNLTGITTTNAGNYTLVVTNAYGAITSSIATLTVLLPPATNQLLISTLGLGTLSPNYSNAWLQVGQNYSITSTPAAGFIFTNWQVSTNWLGGVTVNTTNLNFVMQSNLTLLATFVETSRPTLLITAPTNNQHLTNALATIVGTNSDNWGISGVWYRLNSNAWNSVTTTTNNFINWTQVATLLAGTNTVNAYAVNLGGNYSLTNTVSFVSSNTFALQLVFTNAQPLKTNGLVFSLQLSTGLNGRIQVSTNLTSAANWVTLTNFTGTNSIVTFQDPGATNSSQRFYRAVIP